MTELERWMNDHPPLADALTAEETAALRAKVLARRPRVHVLRGWMTATTPSWPLRWKASWKPAS